MFPEPIKDPLIYNTRLRNITKNVKKAFKIV